MPDCESMFYYRMLRKRFGTMSILSTMKYAYAYHQYRRMERESCVADGDVTYHFVGKADEEFYREVNPDAKVVFLHHPLYQASVAQGGDYPKHFHSPIRIVIAGRYDLFQREATDELVGAMCSTGVLNRLLKSYRITFLGRGWECPAEKLRQVGWQVEVKGWVDDYAAELRSHDIEISPISVGTGTKGKVLDALANGLLVIGTPFALENIAVCDKGPLERECVISYNQAYEVIEVLMKISHDRAMFELMAATGQKTVMRQHNRKTIASELFNLN